MSPRTVQAVAVMTFHGSVGDNAAHARNLRLQAAMIEAIEKCQASGVTDPDVIRDAQLSARDAFLAKE